MGVVLDILDNEVRKKIAASEDVLKEARVRRDLVAESAMGIGGSLRWFRSGSVAHGMVNNPVSDADGGLVLDRRSYPELGPEGQGKGPDEVIDKLCRIVRPKLREKYPKAVVGKSRRGLLVKFCEAVTAQEDPSVDLIVTLTRSHADGLWIPDLEGKREKDRWSPSHPEKHTQLLTGGAKELRALRARVARMAKAWNKQWGAGNRALSSFNIAVLAWEYVQDSSAPLDEALAGWFRYAHDELDTAETEDPAGVSDPIRLLLPRRDVVKRLEAATDNLKEALANGDDEHKARAALSRVYRDYIDPPGKTALAAALRTNSVRATKTGIALGTGVAMKSMRPYGNWRIDG